MSTTDLQALFANLRPKSHDSPAPSQTSHNARQSSHPSPFVGVSPLASSPPPPFTSVPNDHARSTQMAQPVASAAPSATAQSLLNLLNFGSNSNAIGANSRPHSAAENIATTTEEKNGKIPTTRSFGQPPSTSASDLLASFMTPASAQPQSSKSPLNLEDQGGGGGGQPPLENGRDPSQDALLKLLSKAHAAKSTSARDTPVEKSESQPREAQPDLKSVFTSINAPAQSAPADTFTSENKPPAQTQPVFTYTNPFRALNDSLNASRTQSPTVKSRDPAVPKPSEDNEIVPQEQSTPRMASAEQVSKRKILTPRLPSSSKPTPFSREASVDPAVPPSREVEPAQHIVVPASPEPKIKLEEVEKGLESGPGEYPDVEKPANQQSDSKDEWEDMEGSPSKEDARVVPVYNFPIKPFVSIQLNLPGPSGVGIRDDGVMEISRLKKEFDQLDRTLAAATSKYITYALVKNGGMRIIRQDDGSDRQVFRNSGDRIFNVALCTTAATGEPSNDQAVLGTGVSGTVYYATINKNGNDLFEKNLLESESLIFPPYPPADENTAGGVLKTRAKRSSRHPEFFAIGRGKSIHLVWPGTALAPRYGVKEHNRTVDVEKFFEERSLQIATGKAGKDFTFSEDDTLIVSLDKTGRLRFWDIRKLIDESNAGAARVASITIDTPLLSLSTASPSEKSWPTTVTFVDKIRPYTKGAALRYVLVGLRQNHTLQLWDIALGKAVQELNFPHENETDGICSVAYHASSGIIVVGHQTRNSIFFIHLSAPRYTLPTTLSQAAYVQRIAAKDPDLPKPESTACMSGIREMSFAEKGQLRSVEILPIHRTSEAQKAMDERAPLFELYVVHSKGVTCLNITKEDLGWDANSKVIHGIDAATEGLLALKELRIGSVIEEGPRDASPVEEAPAPSKSSKKKSGKKNSVPIDRPESLPTEDVEPAKPAMSQSLSNGPEPVAEAVKAESAPPKESKKSKKKTPMHPEQQEIELGNIITPSPMNALPPPTAANQPFVRDSTPLASVGEGQAKSDAVTVGISGSWLDKELKKVEKTVSSEFRKELGVLYQNIQNDRVVQDSAAIARQEALLRLVSTTLSNNVEKSMSRILSTEMHQSMIPALTAATVQAVGGQVGDAITRSLHSTVGHEMKAQLPGAIHAALQSPNMTRIISDTISSKIAVQLENQLKDVLDNQIVPAFSALAFSAAEKAALEVETRLGNEMRKLENDRRNDMNRLEKLGEVLQATAATLQQMSDTQVAFQGQILRDRHQLAVLEENSQAPASHQVSTARITPSPRAGARPIAPPRQKTKDELELEEISHLMNDGRYEEASIKWLQSSQPAELFDKLFIRFTPEYLSTDVSPLIAFSIAVTIGNSLNTNTAQRLEWISAAFNSVDLSVSSLLAC